MSQCDETVTLGGFGQGILYRQSTNSHLSSASSEGLWGDGHGRGCGCSAGSWVVRVGGRRKK